MTINVNTGIIFENEQKIPSKTFSLKKITKNLLHIS